MFWLTGTCIYKASFGTGVLTKDQPAKRNEPASRASSGDLITPIKVSMMYRHTGVSEDHVILLLYPANQFCFDWQWCFRRGVRRGGGTKEATLILVQHSWKKYFMKTGSRVKIGIFFLVRGTLLILINNVLVKCYCEVFFSGRVWRSVYRFKCEEGDLKKKKGIWDVKRRHKTIITLEIPSFRVFYTSVHECIHQYPW